MQNQEEAYPVQKFFPRPGVEFSLDISGQKINVVVQGMVNTEDGVLINCWLLDENGKPTKENMLVSKEDFWRAQWEQEQIPEPASDELYETSGILEFLKSKLAAIFKPSNNTVGEVTQVEEIVEEQVVEQREVGESEAENVLAVTEIHGDALFGEKLTAQFLKEKRLEPQYQLTLPEEAKIYLSQLYLGNGRNCAVLYVPDGQKYVARTIYQSNSQAMWRYLPNYGIDEENRITPYGKLGDEIKLNMPYQILEKLADIESNTQSINFNEWLLAFAGTARKMDLDELGFEIVDEGLTARQQLEHYPVRLGGEFYPRHEDEKARPEEMGFENPGDKPNFGNLLTSYSQPNPVYGEVTTEVFKSYNGAYTFLFCRDQWNRAWIGGVEWEGPITSVGLRKYWIDAGDLTTPAFEYTQQCKGYENNNVQIQNYKDMWKNYLSNVPLIQEYMRARGYRCEI